VGKAWKMLCEHAAKVSKLVKFLSIEKVTMVSRFVAAYMLEN
jgi:hypothetical protein